MKFSLLFSVLILLFSSFSQKSNSVTKRINRIEIETNKKLSHQVIPYYDKGLVVITDNESKYLGGHYWEINFYDKNLKTVGTTKVELSSKHRLKQAEILDDKLYMFFYRYTQNSMYEQGLELFRIDLNTMTAKNLNHEKPKRTNRENTNYSKLHVIDDHYFISGYIATGWGYEGETFVQIEPGLRKKSNTLYVSNGRIKCKRNKFENIFSVSSESDKQIFAVVVRAVKEKDNEQDRKADKVVVFFNLNGVILNIYNVSKAFSSTNLQLTSVATATQVGSSNIYTGTYVTPESGGKKTLNFLGMTKKGDSEGLYFVREINGELKKKKVINFLELEKFRDLATKRFGASRISKNVDGEEVFTSNILDYKIVKMNDKFYYIGETYMPDYEYRMDADGNSQTVIVGYYHMHALIICFDEDFNIHWHEALPIYENIKGGLGKILSVNSDKESGDLFISWSGSYTRSSYKINKDGKTSIENIFKYIEPESESDKVKKAEDSKTQHWYDSNFIVSGKAKIKDKETGKKRKVFYINHYQRSKKK